MGIEGEGGMPMEAGMPMPEQPPGAMMGQGGGSSPGMMM